MSDINDDLLNYELGDLDEHALLGDEDDLLLSDEEVENQKGSERETWVDNQKQKQIKSGEVTTTSSKVTDISDIKKDDTIGIKKASVSHSESDVSTSDSSPVKKHQQKNVLKITKKDVIVNNPICISEGIIKQDLATNDEVSSTNKEIEASLEHTQSENELLPVSQESSNLDELNYEPDIRDEDSEDNRGERLNIKHANERDDTIESSPDKTNQNNRYPYVRRGRGRGTGGYQPRPHLLPNVRFPYNNHYPPGQYPQNPNENLNPLQTLPSNPYPPGSMPTDLPGNQLPRPPYPSHGHIMNHRQEFQHHRPIGPNFRPQNPNEFGGPRMFIQRPQRPPNGPIYNNAPMNMMRPIYRPSDQMQMRPRMPLRPPLPGNLPMQTNPNSYGNQTYGPQMQHSHLQQTPHNVGGMAPNQNSVVGTAPPLTQKVLINPNFKGGVEAAKSQFIKDTHFIQTIGSHEDDLFQKQEEFIKRNQIYFEKKSRRSPDRSHSRSRTRSRSRSRSRGRVRSRERSYTPPLRRERRDYNYKERRGVGARGGRSKRAVSRDWDSDRKRRRSFTPERRRDKHRIEEDEDEPTRLYRLEIEKQKEMREKILRDKEMRRRKAAEDKANEDKPDDPPAKLKPIVVTESKMISLKRVKEKIESKGETQKGTKKSTATAKSTGTSTDISPPHRIMKRAIPTAKILPGAKRTLAEQIKKDIATSTNSSRATGHGATAIVKPVLKKTHTVQTETKEEDILEDYEDEDENELLEEDRLLASPTPSPSNTPEIEDNEEDDDEIEEEEIEKPTKSFMSSNRKVLIKPMQKSEPTALVDNKKRIFDRLEKYKVGVKKGVKKRIQRIID